MRRVIIGTWVVGLVVWLGAGSAFAGGGGHGKCADAATAVRGTQVRMRQFCFRPSILQIERGATVAFINWDEAPHTVTAADGSWGGDFKFDEAMIRLVRFHAPGVYRYVCLIHPGMTGQIRVGTSTAAGVPSAVHQIAQKTDSAISLGRQPNLDLSTFELTQPVVSTASKTAPPSRAGLWGLLGVVPAAGLIAYGVTHRRRKGSAA